MVSITVKCLFDEPLKVEKEFKTKEVEITLDEPVVFICKQTIDEILEKKKICSLNSIQSIRFFDSDGSWWLLKEDSTINLVGCHPKILLLIQTFENDNNEHNENSFISSSNEFYSKKRSLNYIRDPDIGILSSNPLVENDNDNKLVYLKSLYDFHMEVVNLYKIQKQMNIDVNIQSYPATIDNMKKLIEQNVKILHIICNSIYDINGNLILCFENENSEVCWVSEQTLKGMLVPNKEKDKDTSFDKLKTKKDKSKNKRNWFTEEFINDFKEHAVIIINTPFSQDASNMFINLGFKNVISIHTNRTNSLISQKFNEYFYLCLSQRSTFIDAFHSGQNLNLNSTEKSEVQCCCCFHSHSKECKWKQFAISNPIEAHKKHLRSKICKCNFDNFSVHLSFCDFCKKFEYKSKNTNICCCNKNLNHSKSGVIFGVFGQNEENNIMFHEQGGFANINNGKLESIINNLQYIENRNREIHLISNLLFKCKAKFICVYGKDTAKFLKVLFAYLSFRHNSKFIEMIDLTNIDLNKMILFEDYTIYLIDATQKTRDDILNIKQQFFNWDNIDTIQLVLASLQEISFTGSQLNSIELK